MDPGRDDPRYQVGKIGEGARVAIGNHIIWIEAAQAPRALYQLPVDIADFTDREAELAELGAMAQPAVEARSARVLGVAGPPGVGKSALALRLAHRLAKHFPDTQLYVNLRTLDGQPLAAEDVLAGFLRALGVSEEAMPSTVEERAAVFRSQLSDKRALVLLDNARQESQVRPLLPAGPGCLALVTSRASLPTLNEANHFQKIEVLESEAAIELLGRIAGVERMAAEPDAARALAILCGGLPLALRIAGARLRERDRWSVDRLVQRLSDERQRLAELKTGDPEVRAAFALSYDELSERQRRLFRLLSLVGGPDFGIPVAAALIESTTDETEDALGKLQNAQLLEAPSEDRYRFHDLLRLFAVERLETDERSEEREHALLRALGWYLERAAAAAAVLDPIASLGDYLEAAFAWFEAERLGLIAVVELAHGAGLWKAVLHLAEKLIRFFSLRSYWADWERIATLASVAARELGDRHDEGQALNNLGTVYDKQGRWKESLACHEQSLEICRQLGNRLGEGQALTNLGLVYYNQGRWAEAIACYEQSLLIFRQLGHRHAEGQALTNLGMVYDKQGRWEEAIACYEQSLPIFLQSSDDHGKGLILNNLGTVYDKQGRWEEAIACFEQSLAIHRQLGDRHGEGQALNNLGMVYDKQGRWEEAIACYEQDSAICRQLGDRHGEGQALNNLGTVYAKQRRWKEAVVCFEQDQAICRQVGDPHGEGLTLNNLGAVYYKQGRLEEAIACYEQSLAIHRQLGDPHGEGQTLNNLGLVYDKQGRLEEAIACYEQSLTICRKLGDLPGDGQTSANLGLLYNKQGRSKEGIVCNEQSLAIFRQLGDLHGEGQTLNNLGLIYGKQGRSEEAVVCHGQSLAIYRQIEDRLGEGEATANLGVLLHSQGDHEGARSRWQEALRILETLDAPEETATVRGWLTTDL